MKSGKDLFQEKTRTTCLGCGAKIDARSSSNYTCSACAQRLMAAQITSGELARNINTILGQSSLPAKANP